MHRILTLLVLGLMASAPLTDFSEVCGQQSLDPRALVTIPVNLNPRDSFSLPMEMPGLNAPEYDPVFLSEIETLKRLGRGVIFFRDIWEYEFAFVGGPRQALLEVPQLGSGQAVRKNIWYIVYRVRNRGNTLTYEKIKQNPEFDHLLSDLRKDKPIPSEQRRFMPRFYLEGSVMADPSQGYSRVKYSDKISPMVLRQIQRLHDPNLPLLDSFQMSQVEIPLAATDADGGVWGVAIFEDVDPRIDFVSLYVEGLSNAFRISGEPGQANVKKVLQLNFWRPGGIVNDEKDPVDYGIPLVDGPVRQVLIAERYNLPGPLIRSYHISEEAGERLVLLAEVDAQVDLKTFESDLVPLLDQKRLPEVVRKSLEDAGLDSGAIEGFNVEIPKERWSFKIGAESYRIAFEPQFWEPIKERNVNRIRFIKGLDHLWIYR